MSLESRHVPIQFSFVDNDEYELSSVILLSMAVTTALNSVFVEDTNTTIRLLDDDGKLWPR